MGKLGFAKEGRVSYGKVYRRTSTPQRLAKARRVERLSRRLHRAKTLLQGAMPV